MKLTTLVSGAVLFIGLGLVAFFQLNKDSERSQSTIIWQKVKPGSIYDGDSLRVIDGDEELKIKFCGIDAPELDQPLGIESRDYLRSLIAKGDGRIYAAHIEKDKYGYTVAELWMPIKPDFKQQIYLNAEMVEAGYAWHYEKYSGNCHSPENLVWAENIARDKKLGIWKGNHQKPWDFRASKKSNK